MGIEGAGSEGGVMDRKGNILVVDDDATVRSGLNRILDAQGYAVETASTASEALEMLSHHPFDLVLTDLQMPGMDGLELLGEIKGRTSNMPVVMITGHGSMDTVIQALRRGVSDFVNKPFHPDDILNIVDREVALHRQETPDRAPSVFGLQLSPQQLDEIDRLLAQLRAEVGARCVLLIEGTGHLIDAKGIIEDLNVSALATLVAGDFAATAGIASLIGEEDSFRLNYHEGDQYSVYSAQIAPDVFLLVLFGQEIKLGSVLYYAKNILPQLEEVVTQAAPPTPTPTPTPPPAPTATPTTSPSPSSSPSPSPSPSPQPEPTPDLPTTPSQAPSEMPASTPSETFSLEEIVDSGLLDDQALDALDAQFTSLWT